MSTQNRNPNLKPEPTPNSNSGQNLYPKPKSADTRNPTGNPKPGFFTNKRSRRIIGCPPSCGVPPHLRAGPGRPLALRRAGDLARGRLRPAPLHLLACVRGRGRRRGGAGGGGAGRGRWRPQEPASGRGEAWSAVPVLRVVLSPGRGRRLSGPRGEGEARGNEGGQGDFHILYT